MALAPGAPVNLPEHFPLQQGLKLFMIDTLEISQALPEHFPLQQGLKLTFALLVPAPGEALPEHFPLQQGLKLALATLIVRFEVAS